jgi:hypothetical protein
MRSKRIVQVTADRLLSEFQPHVTLPVLTRAYRKARGDLEAVGLLADGLYLDRIQCHLTWVPGFSAELGFVYDEDVWWWPKLWGYQPGMIYVPPNAPTDKYTPGGTLLDTVRHEFGHAWAWLDPAYFRRPWFTEAFGGRYWARWPVQPAFDPAHFVSEYATTSPAEDFCETFAYYLKYRRSLVRFRRRRGLWRKLRAVQRAVEVAARERAPRIRGPRATKRRRRRGR